MEANAMTNDEIIEMGNKAKLPYDYVTGELMWLDGLEYFAKMVAEKEREACATMSDWILKEGGGTWGDAIRARKDNA
jgi:hypothetical protein